MKAMSNNFNLSMKDWDPSSSK